MRAIKQLVKGKTETALFLLILLFSFWLMFSSFGYSNDQMLIGSKAWSDFASHIPLIRSFSFGFNFPPEYPLFPNEPIKYHYLFYLIVGLVEKSGIRIDIALNTLSALSLTFLIMMIYLLGKKLFRSTAVGLLSVIFFIFNGSLSFIEFFKQHPLSANSISDIFNLSQFSSFGPYDGRIVSAFWNLNIYTNQRHLALSFGLVLFLIYLSLSKINKIKILTMILILIILYFLNQISFFIALLFLYSYMFFKFRKLALILLPLPILLISVIPTKFIVPHIGFLTPEPVNAASIINFWFYNIGLFLLLIPLAFIKYFKKHAQLIIPLLVLFLIPNIFKLSPDIINNHKLFNFFLIVSSIFVSAFLINAWRKNLLGKSVVPIFIFLLTFSGVIDIMPLKNDYRIPLPDIAKNEDAQFFLRETPPNSVVLNSRFLYHPASLSGRKVFFGYPYFAWSYGYDTESRQKFVKQIYSSNDKNEACKFLTKSNISFLEINPNSEEFIKINQEFWKKAPAVYFNKKSGLKVLDVKSYCYL